MNETKNPQHLDCGRSIPATHGGFGDKTIPDSAEPRLESFYPPFVAGIDLPHQGVVDSYNPPFVAGIDLPHQGVVDSYNPTYTMGNTMMTSSDGNIFCVTGPLCGEFTGPGEFPTQRQVTRIFDDFFELRLNKRMSKQPWGWWFETLSWSLWRHCNAIAVDDLATQGSRASVVIEFT